MAVTEFRSITVTSTTEKFLGVVSMAGANAVGVQIVVTNWASGTFDVVVYESIAPGQFIPRKTISSNAAVGPMMDIVVTGTGTNDLRGAALVMLTAKASVAVTIVADVSVNTLMV
jgi:hypothetical protein